MSFPSAYRAFAPAKFVRTGILVDADRRHGHVWAKKLGGGHAQTPLLLAAKFAEELAELVEAYQAIPTQPAAVLEESGDVLATIALARQLYPSVPLQGRYKGNLNDLRLRWETLHAELVNGQRTQPGALRRIAELVPRTHNGLLVFFKQAGLTLAEVEAAAAAKNQHKGKLEGWYLEFIALPANDKWVKSFAVKAPEVTPEYLSLARVLHNVEQQTQGQGGSSVVRHEFSDDD